MRRMSRVGLSRASIFPVRRVHNLRMYDMLKSRVLHLMAFVYRHSPFLYFDGWSIVL
jgi:hypothetical protein